MARESGQGSGGKGDGKKVLSQRRQDRKMARETGQKAGARREAHGLECERPRGWVCGAAEGMEAHLLGPRPLDMAPEQSSW